MTRQIDHGLDEAQKIFIRNKVKQLGSISSVDKFYHGDCSVNKYAKEVAREIYYQDNNSYIKNPRQKSEDKAPLIGNQGANKYSIISKSQKPTLKQDAGKRHNTDIASDQENDRLCVDCGAIIPLERIRAIPSVSLCVKCQSILEKKVLSILLCKIFISQFFEERQIFTHFTYRV